MLTLQTTVDLLGSDEKRKNYFSVLFLFSCRNNNQYLTCSYKIYQCTGVMDDTAAASYPNKDKVVFNKTMLFFNAKAWWLVELSSVLAPPSSVTQHQECRNNGCNIAYFTLWLSLTVKFTYKCVQSFHFYWVSASRCIFSSPSSLVFSPRGLERVSYRRWTPR